MEAAGLGAPLVTLWSTWGTEAGGVYQEQRLAVPPRLCVTCEPCHLLTYCLILLQSPEEHVT